MRIWRGVIITLIYFSRRSLIFAAANAEMVRLAAVPETATLVHLEAGLRAEMEDGVQFVERPVGQLAIIR